MQSYHGVFMSVKFTEPSSQGFAVSDQIFTFFEMIKFENKKEQQMLEKLQKEKSSEQI